MEQKTGFLLHLDMAYPTIMTFLRGIYLTTNLWRIRQDRDGWNLSKGAYDAYLNAGLGEGSAKFSSNYYEEENIPSKLKAFPCVFKHFWCYPYYLGTMKHLCV